MGLADRSTILRKSGNWAKAPMGLFSRAERGKRDNRFVLIMAINVHSSCSLLIQVALKQVRLDLKKEGVSISVMREIQSLMDIEHQNIVRLFDVVVGRRIDRIFLVREYCDQVLRK